MIYLEKLEEAKKKKGRCWTGYKPKPGSVPYSKGSCVKEAYKLIGLALTDLEEGAAKRAGLSKKQHRNLMMAVSNVTAAETKASGSKPSDAFKRGVERGARGEILRRHERKRREAMEKKAMEKEATEKKALDVAHTSYQQIGDILAEAILGKIRSKVADKLDNFSRKQYRKGEVDDASGKEWRAGLRGKVAHVAGKVAQKVRPKDEG